MVANFSETAPYTSLSAEEEVRIAYAMRRAEASATQLIAELDHARPFLQKQRRRSQRTRAIDVARLVEAVEHCELMTHLNAQQRATDSTARARLHDAERAHWLPGSSACCHGEYMFCF